VTILSIVACYLVMDQVSEIVFFWGYYNTHISTKVENGSSGKNFQKKPQILSTRSVTNIAYYISNIAVLISKEKEENTFF